jgi:hypothetical protein
MRQLITIFLILSASTILLGQEFCGHIKYKYTYYNAKTNKDITDKKMKEVKTEDYYICGNKFKVIINGEFNDMYIGDSTTYFLLTRGTIGYINAGKSYGEKIPSYSKIKDNIEYKGKMYKTVDLDNITYYYNDSIRIDPASFESLELYHWNKFFKTTNGGLRLVSINRTKKMTILCEAIEIIWKELSDKDFTPPTGYEIKPFDTFTVMN